MRYLASFAGRRQVKKQQNVIDLRDPKVREEFLMREMTLANQKMMEGVYMRGREGEGGASIIHNRAYFCLLLHYPFEHDTYGRRQSTIQSTL